MRAIAIVLLCAVAATAGNPGAQSAVVSAMREYYGLLGSSGNGNIESVRDRLIANVRYVSPKTQKSVRTMIDKGFGGKYKKNAAFHKCLAEILAAQGKYGLNKLFQRYKKMKKSTDTRVGIAEAMGSCKNPYALGLLLKIVHDKQPAVVAAAAQAMTEHIPKSEKTKRSVMRTLIDIYTKSTAKAQGKDRDSKQRKAYETLKPVLDKTLDTYSGGEKLDSAQAWDAWLREQTTKG